VLTARDLAELEALFERVARRVVREELAALIHSRGASVSNLAPGEENPECDNGRNESMDPTSTAADGASSKFQQLASQRWSRLRRKKRQTSTPPPRAARRRAEP
jgi:hypothetical protein